MEETREKDKPIHLPYIMKTMDNQDSKNEEYKNSSSHCQTSMNDARSLMSLSNESKNFKDYTLRENSKTVNKKRVPSSNSKSQVSGRRTQFRKQYADFTPVDHEDASLTKHIQKIYRNKKCSFVKFDTKRKLDNRSGYCAKSQTRKSTISYLPPEHREVIDKCIDMRKSIQSSKRSLKKKSKERSVCNSKKVFFKKSILSSKTVGRNTRDPISIMMVNGRQPGN
mmetsp:Transcript_30343/g.26888  ORF Transcript_30343/g.26888 Transcript_30343/m.26888 type:complete len:224 (+) Transcript_30343:396-1067(+)